MSSPTIQPLLSAGRYILVASLATKFIKLTKIMFPTRAPFCLLFTPFALFPPFLRVSFVNWSCPFQPVFLFIPLSVFLLCHASCSRVRCLLCASCSKVCSVFLLGTFYTSSFLQCCTRLRLVLCCLLRQFFLSLGLIFGIYCTLDFSMLFVSYPPPRVSHKLSRKEMSLHIFFP